MAFFSRSLGVKVGSWGETMGIKGGCIKRQGKRDIK